MLELTNELLIQLLIFVLIFFFTFQATMKFFKNRSVSAVIGLVITLIVIFYFDYSQISSLIDLYGTTGLILLISVPFVIVFFFAYSLSITGVLRKIIFIFYGAITILFLQKNNSFSSETTTFIILLFSFILLIILFLDTKIKNKFNIRKNLRR